VSASTVALALGCYGALCLFAYCRLLGRMQPRQPIPPHYQLLAWLGFLATFGAACFAVAFFLTIGG
jgi:hypothetical protein